MAGYILRNSPKQHAAPKGLGVPRVACATYDFAVDGGAVAAHPLGVEIPKGAVVVDSLIDVLTTCVGDTGETATMAIHLQSANDIVSAIAIGDTGAPWDAGLHAGVPVGTAATSIKMTADRQITATIGTEAFTAGKFRVWIHYVI